jgi:hypothetical protein
MPSLNGDISVMPLADLLQWVGICSKTGTVQINKSGIEKKIYVETGKVSLYLQIWKVRGSVIPPKGPP